MYVLIFGSMKAQIRLNWPAQVAVLLGVVGVCMILGAFGMQALASAMDVRIENGSISTTIYDPKSRIGVVSRSLLVGIQI